MSAPAKKRPTPNGKRSPQPASRWEVAGLCLLLAAITFAVFGQTLYHGFINYDDPQYVYNNPVVVRGLTINGIVWAFTGAHASNWHPLTWLSHMLDCQIYGLRPGGHHLTNVLLHTATVIALFLVLRQMTGSLWRSAFVAAVFAVHPLRAESVAWVAERKDVLSGLFFMLTVGAYVRYARRPWSPLRYGLVLLLFACGLMSKPMLVSLPLVLLLLDYWPLQRKVSAGRLMLEKLPLLILSGVSCVITLLAQREAIFQSVGSFSLANRPGNALVSVAVYLGQMIWPQGLAAFYPYPLAGLPGWEVVLAGALLAGLTAFAWWQRRKQPWLLIGWLWYVIMLLPVLGIVQAGGQSHADRYTYLPQIGICLAATWWVAECGQKRRFGRVAFGCLMVVTLAILMAVSWKQTAYWRDSETLWIHALHCTTDNDVANNSLGLALSEKGEANEAIARFQQALQINPGYAPAHGSLGDILLQMGRVDDAISHYQSALQIEPNDPVVIENFGIALFQKGSVDEAITQFQRALQLNPDYAAHNNLGIALMKQGKVDEAIAEYRQALQVKPDAAEAHNNLGNALLRKGNVDEAIAQFQKALQINPVFVKARSNLSRAVQQKEKVPEATGLPTHR